MKMHKELKFLRERRFTTVAGVCIAIMLVITAVCIFYFIRQLNHVRYEEPQSEEYASHYAFITEERSDLFFEAVYEAAKTSGAAADVYVECTGRELAVEYDKSQLMKIAINSKVDGIILEADESEETAALINEAVDQGIPVVALGSDCAESRRQSYVGLGNYSLGQEYGRQILAQAHGEPQRILVLMSPNADDRRQNLIYSGIMDTLEPNRHMDGTAGIYTVETLAVNDETTFGAEESIRDIIVDDTQLPDILICLNEQTTRCAYNAIVDYNQVGNVKIFGYYENDTILDAISKEIIDCTISIDTEQMGRYCVEALNEYRSYGYVNEYIPVDTLLITKNNVGEYISDAKEQE